jgi:hypothetical protein
VRKTENKAGAKGVAIEKIKYPMNVSKFEYRHHDFDQINLRIGFRNNESTILSTF